MISERISMRIFKRMLVGISLLTLQLPILWAEPDPLLIYFAITDNADEVFTPDSFSVTGVDNAVVVKDTRRPKIAPNSRLTWFFMVSMAQLPVGEYTVTVTVTDKGGLTASKDFRIVVTTNTVPKFEDSNAQGQIQGPQEEPKEEPKAS